jgi:hypothetical protein
LQDKLADQPADCVDGEYGASYRGSRDGASDLLGFGDQHAYFLAISLDLSEAVHVFDARHAERAQEASKIVR